MTGGFPLAVYVHWPFCLRKCPYCDFNSHVADAVDHRRWRRALGAELEHFAAKTRDRPLASLFFGGGTPSLMEAETVADLIARARALWPSPAPDEVEITLEANPGTVDRARFQAFREAGVTRLSLGVQALDEAALGLLGRIHGVAEALAAVEAARHVFPRLSLDLIYARPGQTDASWREELARVLDLAPDHLSLYQLTIEPGTAFHRVHAPPGEDEAARLFETTQDMTAAAGLPAYEISNHARPGRECRHNLAYWRGCDYVGVGPGAHGRITGRHGVDAVRQRRAPGRWLAEVEAEGHATRERETLSPGDRAVELLLMGLRLTEGVARDRFRRQCGMELEDVLAPGAAQALADHVSLDGTGLRTTPAGRLTLNEVLRQLLHGCPA
ncbi:MAG: coproporphyrinogen III oxidase [Alphaproteobacteria bacterium]|nr:coproporphyrinogen III oxidase [Alphaproteobacteria bacterium]